MTPQPIAALLCDDLRPELSGKFFAVGAYTTDITFPRFPTAGKFSLMLLLKIEDGTDKYPISVRLRMGEETLVQFSGELEVPNAVDQEYVWVPFGDMPPISVVAAGDMIFECEQGEDNWSVFYKLPVRRQQPPN